MEKRISNMVEKELKRLERNLIKKNALLDQMHEVYDRLSALLEDIDMEVEVFDVCMDEQDELLQELLVLDEDMGGVYETLRSEKIVGDGSYALLAESLKNLISQIVDKANSLREKEYITKQKVETYFDHERKNLGDGRKSSKAALDYYKSMTRSGVVPPQFMDQKK